MKNSWFVVAAAVVLVVAGFSGLPAFAQQTGSIEGTIVDSNGSPLPGVAVEVKSPVLQGTRTSVTDATGRYRFPVLGPGTYSVSAALAGFTRVEKTNQKVSLGATTTANMTLQISAKGEIVVTGEAPVVDTTKTTIGTNASLETIQKLPLGRNFTAIAATVAGTGTDVSGTFTVYGATGLENAYIIDGINTTGIKTGTQTKQMNQEFVQEVEVKTGGYEAEYGRVLGGTVNVVTKSGGNEFHGDVFGYYDSSSLASSDSNAAARKDVAQGTYYDPKRADYGLDLGGYFLKDRIWFFGAYDRLTIDQQTERVLQTLRDANKTSVMTGGTDETRRNLFSGKLTFRLGESNTVSVAAIGDPGTFSGQISTAPGPDSARVAQIDQGSTDFAAKWDGIFGTKFLAQAQYGFHKDRNEQSSAYAGSLYREQSQAGYTTEALPGSGPGILYNESYKRNDYKLSGTFFLGSNEVKLGVDYEAIRSSFSELYGGTDRLTLRLSAAGALNNVQHRYFAKTPIESNCIAPIDPKKPFSIYNCNGYAIASSVDNPPATDNLALFLQDSWKVLPNLTVNVGIRYEEQKVKDYTGATLIDVKDQWSPRIGFVWDFLNNGKSKLYANYGRFYQTIPQDIQTRALGNEYTIFVRNQSTNKADPVNTIFPYASVQGGELTQDGLKGMYQDEMIGGLEIEVAPNWAIGVKGIYRALGRVIEDRCDVAVNPDISSFIPPGSTATCALINIGQGNALGTIKDPADPTCYPNGYPAADGSIPVAAPCESTNARRYFRGFEVTAQHRFANNFYMQASYLYSQLIGNYSGNLSQTREGGQADPNINADFDYPGLVTNATGLLRNNRTQQFKLSGYYAFPFGLNVGLAAYYTTGRPYSIRGCALDRVACEGGYSQEGYLLPRGSAGTLPATYEADLHLEYAFRIGMVSITPIVDVFNLLNAQRVTSREELFNNSGSLASNAPCADGTYSASCSPNPNFGKDIAWQNPRIIRLGARVSF